MTNTIKHEDVVCGMWKFHEGVLLEELVKLAEEWRDGTDGNNYLDLHIRKCSKDQNGIGFMYQYRGRDSGFESFFYKMTDKLKRRFGNHFVGHDISSFVVIIK